MMSRPVPVDSSQPDRPPKSHGRLVTRQHLRDTVWGYGLILPSLLVFLIFFYGPALFLAYIAFFHWSIFASQSTFVGLKNFTTLLHQPIFWQSLLNTAYYVVAVVPPPSPTATAPRRKGARRVNAPPAPAAHKTPRDSRSRYADNGNVMS
jgi:hypothetical protein